jgi:hypothetical protein
MADFDANRPQGARHVTVFNGSLWRDVLTTNGAKIKTSAAQARLRTAKRSTPGGP